MRRSWINGRHVRRMKVLQPLLIKGCFGVKQAIYFYFMQPTPFGLDNFTLLERRGNSEVAYGLAGKLWRANYGQATLADVHAFQAFDTFGSVKLVVSSECRLLEAGLTRVVTETRVHCLDNHALRRFTPYWYVIRPVSGIIRRRMLKIVARECRYPRL
ncbi:hypothetical protein ALO53_102243 [Pseudomonas amygdali pv. photiniae]|uniref:Uncharacterized protein n=2 Tax=Pseudomonas amygdali pv. photiniae TaxID=251724 RepID=A0A0P9SQF9_PSEA0|nr:hypothetical protein ALO53_102243 [Pseudomonas amygdali pv. photiniae]